MANARILVTADEWLAAPGIKEELAALGYEVVAAAASDQEILRLASEGPLDLVLMDINLPGDLDGIEAAEQLRRQFGIPMVFLTKCADPQTLARA